HLHYEVHPNALLSLGYDGAVDPTSYLAEWRRLDRVKAPPPAPLPSSAGVGHGAVSDFRRLLAIRPLPHRRSPPSAHGHSPARASSTPPLPQTQPAVCRWDASWSQKGS